MSYKSDAEKLQMFLNCIQEMTSIALTLAEKEGEIENIRTYLRYVAENSGGFVESYEDWTPSDHLSTSDLRDSWNSSSCY
jgi:hypothetical protein